MNKPVYILNFLKPGTKSTFLFVERLLKNGEAFLSTLEKEESFDFESWGNAKDAISKFAYPYRNYAFNILKIDSKTFKDLSVTDTDKSKKNSPKEKETSTIVPRKSGAVADIINLYKSGKTKAEIIAAGYNKNTVNRQVGEYIKSQKK